jgi:hypothetical protein
MPDADKHSKAEKGKPLDVFLGAIVQFVLINT